MTLNTKTKTAQTKCLKTNKNKIYITYPPLKTIINNN